MSMMVNPVSVSNVRFCGEANAADVLGRAGKFSNGAAAPEAASVTAEQAPKKKKSYKFLKTVAALVVVAGALAALPKIFPNAIKTIEKDAMKDAKFMQKVGHYLAVAGEGIAKYTYKPLVNLFSKDKGKTAGEAGEVAAKLFA